MVRVASVEIGRLDAQCPKCGSSEMWVMTAHHIVLLGNLFFDYALCRTCKTEWSIDHAPDDFFTDNREMWKAKSG